MNCVKNMLTVAGVGRVVSLAASVLLPQSLPPLLDEGCDLGPHLWQCVDPTQKSHVAA